MPDITGINHVSVTVTDVDKSVEWYKQVLGLVELMKEQHPADEGYGVVLGKPDWSICVGVHTHPTNGKERFSEDRTGLDHVGFMVANRGELDTWKQRLEELGVEHSPINDRQGYATLVFRDPDNIQLEFMSMG
jgi:catechol 2,3-dioxygenase-like lactoylglutathione lyase family enzyme